MTVQNNTGKVVLVKGKSCHIEIPIGASAEIPEDALTEDSRLTVEYFSLKSEATETVEEVHRNHRGWCLDVYNRSTMPVVTVLDARGCDAITLEKGDVSFFFIFCFWKRYAVKRIAVKFPNAEKGHRRVNYYFRDDENRRRLRLFSLIELIPALLLTLGAIFATVTIDRGLFGIVLSLLCLYRTGELIYHYLTMGKWVESLS